MRYLRWLLLVLLLITPVLLLAVVFSPSWLDSPRALSQPRPVPPGDQEIAWIHTTTHGVAWERFVTGLKRIEMLIPGLHIDDADAFLDETTAVPEVVIRKDGHAGALRVRWYKITGEVTTAHWIRSLARRDPAPLGFIGGGSSDRAVELARALRRQESWHGDRPVLLLTTATADEVEDDGEDEPRGPDTGPKQPPRLIHIYKDRSFRFCFTNHQMAEAVTDFVFADPSLRPGPIQWPGLRMVPLGAAGTWGAIGGVPDFLTEPEPHIFTAAWQDDSYSIDLSWQFKSAIRKQFPTLEDDVYAMKPQFHSESVPFSVGSLYVPNRYEAQSVDAFVNQLPPHEERALVVLPTSPPSARRFLRTLCEAAPLAERRLVAVTGDSIGMNVIYRDGEFAWPVRAMPVPLVMFTHNSPFAWDEPGGPVPPPGAELRPPNSTEDALHFAELGRHMIEAAFPPPAEQKPETTQSGLARRADVIASRLKGRWPRFFDENGDRISGTGEFIVVLRPTIAGEGPPTSPPPPDATIDVYRRSPWIGWDRVRTLPITHTRRLSGGMAG